MSRITEFYRISPAAPAREQDEASRDKYYRRLRLQAFVAATLGYSLYYVCRTSLNVMKKPILDSGSLDASQLGVIGSALLFAYAIGKFVNGFIADYCNIKRFMATGLIVSAAANALMGLMGLAHSVVPTAVIFVAFAVMWGLNGWAQSMGAPPAIISLSRWNPLMYISRYAINGWGVLFLQEAKGFSDVEAISVVSINALLGILGTVLSGWFSDKLFKGDRKIPALLFGILNSLALALFLYGGNAMWVNVLSMVLFGIAIGVLICFLGGLMAVDIVPRKATGAALGVVGIASYIAAGIQDVASGWLIDRHITVAADGAKHYDFGPVALFWIAASVISFLLPLLNRKKDKG